MPPLDDLKKAHAAQGRAQLNDDNVDELLDDDGKFPDGTECRVLAGYDDNGAPIWREATYAESRRIRADVKIKAARAKRRRELRSKQRL